MTLTYYFARRFLWSVTEIFLIFFAIMLLIETVEQLRRFADAGIGMSQAAKMALLAVPDTIYRILPLIMIMGAIANFLSLARSSELVALRAAGRSGLHFLVTPVAVALVLGFLTIAFFNPLVAATTKRYETERASFGKGDGSVLSFSESGLWLRQGGNEGQTVVQAARSGPDGTELFGATFLTFGRDGLPLTRIEAEKAQLAPGGWVLTGVKSWTLSDPNPELSAKAEPGPVTVASDLTAERIRDSFGSPSEIAFWSLPGYISGLDRAGLSSLTHRIWFQMELAQPVLMAAMVLIAAGFTMRHARFGGTGKMVLYAMLSGFGIFFLRNFAQAMGDTSQIPVALAAWSPPLIALLLSLGFLLHLEEG